jgi:acyl-CoA synthetase (NDP forming)
MDRFFHPASIAVVGASNRKGGYQLIKNLLYGYRGTIYPINPNHKEIGGIPCFRSIEDIAGKVDLAIILVPAQVVPSVLEACGRRGVFRVMIESAGFAEVGNEGRAIQDHCAAIAREAGIRIWGPNCMGLVDVPRKHLFTFMTPLIYKDSLIPGRISIIAQSGMLSAAFLSDLMSRRKIGIGKVCSIGNKADVDECNILEYLLDDTETDVVALYLESVLRGRLFAQIASTSDKPIVLLKGGKSEAGGKAAISHTHSLSGNSRLLDSVLQMSGVTLANDFHQMIDMAVALAVKPRVPSTCHTAILTFSGAAGIVSCDLLEKHGLEVAKLSDNTIDALGDIFPDWMPVENPIDLFPAMELHGRALTYNRAISIVLDDPNVDVLLVNYPEGLEAGSIDLDALKKKADTSGKNVVFWLLGREKATTMFYRRAKAYGITVYWEISRAIECLSAAARFQRYKKIEKMDGPAVSPISKNNLQEYV